MSRSSTSSSSRRTRNGIAALLGGVALFFLLDRLAFDVADPWPFVEERIPAGYRAEIGVVRDEITYRRMAARVVAGQPRVFVLGTSRARAAFRPETLPEEANPQRFGVIAHAGMMPFEMRSQLQRLLTASPDAVVILLSEFELFHPLQLNPWLATGAFDATAELAREAGAAYVLERRETFLQLAAVGLLGSYRFRAPLGRASLDALRTFRTGPRIPDPRPKPFLYPPGRGEGFASARERVAALIDEHLAPSRRLVARFEMAQVASLGRGDDARIQGALLRTLVGALRSAGTAVLVVELPILPGAESLYDPGLREDFLTFAAGLRRDFGVRLVPRGALPTVAPSEFHDLTHLGPDAARRWTRRVARLVDESLAP